VHARGEHRVEERPASPIATRRSPAPRRYWKSAVASIARVRGAPRSRFATAGTREHLAPDRVVVGAGAAPPYQSQSITAPTGAPPSANGISHIHPNGGDHRDRAASSPVSGSHRRSGSERRGAGSIALAQRQLRAEQRLAAQQSATGARRHGGFRRRAQRAGRARAAEHHLSTSVWSQASRPVSSAASQRIWSKSARRTSYEWSAIQRLAFGKCEYSGCSPSAKQK
jgi:hypothetical protein